MSNSISFSDRIELHGGDGFSYGNVFATNLNGYFGPVCDDGWGDIEATIVCQQLGFWSGEARTSSTWGSVPNMFSMDQVQCTGNERTLQDCYYEPRDDCDSNEGAGVLCTL